MGYRIVRKPSKAYIVRSGTNYYAEDDITLQNSLGTTTQDFYGALVNTVYGLIYIGNDTYLVATADLEMVGDVSDYNQIQSMDDITPARYAYSNQNGYVIGIGTELNGTYENGVFMVGSGLAVVQGVEIDIDANGITTALDTANETRYYKIYLEVNFNRAINLYNATLKSYYSTVSYDEIQDPTFGELRNNQTAYLELYRIKLNGATEIEKSKTVNEVKYNITDAETINGLSITQDNNNVLHVGDEIISKKKLLWIGNEECGTEYLLLKQPDVNPQIFEYKNLEFVVTYNDHNEAFQNRYICYNLKPNNLFYTIAPTNRLMNDLVLTIGNTQFEGYRLSVKVGNTTDDSYKLKAIYEIIE